MKRVGVFLLRNIFLDTVIFLFACFAIRELLGAFDLSFRQWMGVAVVVLVAVGTVVGLIQLLRQMGKQSVKIAMLLSALLVALALFRWRPLLFAAALSLPNEYVTERGGSRYVVVLSQWHHTTATYYDYKNVFIRGRKPRIEEFYRYGDPRSKDPPTSAKYYDADGNLTGEIVEEDWDGSVS